MKYYKSFLSIFHIFVSIQIFAQQKNEFTISSSGIKSDGSLVIEFTGEGEGLSMPLEWTNIPEGTKYFALNLWHFPHATDSSDVKSYCVVYNIPSDIKNIPKNAKGFGSDGYNDKNQTGYDPMNSKGPDIKEYNLTIFALSEKLDFNNDKVYRIDLLKAIEGKVLGKSTLIYTYVTGLINESAQKLRDSEERIETLTEVQKEKVKAILSNHNATTLTTNDAKAIHETFRDAGLRNGPVVDVVIKEAGFNPHKLKELEPTPVKN